MKKIVFVILLFFFSLAFAQAETLTQDPTKSVQGHGGGPDPDVPINQGVVFLLVAGIGFAVWHFRKNETKKFFNEKATWFKQLHRG